MGLKPGQIYWGHSHADDGRYTGAHLTREAAIAEGQAEYDGEPFWVCCGPAITPRIDADHVIDMIRDNAHEDSGGAVDDPIDLLPDHDTLQDILDLWCEQHVEVNAWRAGREPERIEPCQTCGCDGIVVTWVHRECDGVDLDPETHTLCPDCTETYGPVPPWADYPTCPECDAGYGDLVDGHLECVGCAHTWEPTDDERIMAERAEQAGSELDARTIEAQP